MKTMWAAIAAIAIAQIVTVLSFSHELTLARDRMRFTECFVDLDPPDGEMPCGCDSYDCDD